MTAVCAVVLLVVFGTVLRLTGIDSLTRNAVQLAQGALRQMRMPQLGDQDRERLARQAARRMGAIALGMCVRLLLSVMAAGLAGVVVVGTGVVTKWGLWAALWSWPVILLSLVASIFLMAI